jgi:hypothetical protein
LWKSKTMADLVARKAHCLEMKRLRSHNPKQSLLVESIAVCRHTYLPCFISNYEAHHMHFLIPQIVNVSYLGYAISFINVSQNMAIKTHHLSLNMVTDMFSCSKSRMMELWIVWNWTRITENGNSLTLSMYGTEPVIYSCCGNKTAMLKMKPSLSLLGVSGSN